MAASQASQFIGSKISLVTKAEIRYEGILYALDMNEATISLARVKSFGTEDRPTERPSPPKDEVFEFIIFRGADIKSLDVVEPPKSVTALPSGNSTPPNDPAIVEVSYYHSSGNGHGNSAGKGVLNSLLNGRSPGKRRNSGGGQRRRRRSAHVDAGAQSGGQGQRRGRGNKKSGGDKSGNQSDSSQNVATSPTGQRQNGRGRNRGRPTRQDSADASAAFFAQMQQAAPHAYFQPPPPFMMRPPGGFMGRGGYRGGRGRGGGGMGFGGRRNYNQQPQGIIEAQQPAKVTFEEPFDFEKSHEELVQTLAKLEIVDKEKAAAAAENGNVEHGGDSDGEKDKDAAGADVVYYSKENFFDNISCDALKKLRPGKNVRMDRRAEMKLNTETFGASASRGGPRRGGGGYGYYNNRNNYYHSNPNPYFAMMAGGYDPTPAYFMPGNGGYGNYRRGGGGGGGGRGGGGGGGGGRSFYRNGFYDNF